VARYDADIGTELDCGIAAVSSCWKMRAAVESQPNTGGAHAFDVRMWNGKMPLSKLFEPAQPHEKDLQDGGNQAW